MTEEKKKNLIQKLQDKIPDRDEQFEYISIAVRLLVVFWSGALVTLNYLPKIPGLTSGEKQDITFPASLLASSLASFGLEKSNKKKENGDTNGAATTEKNSKDELKEILGNTQLVRIETPIKIVNQEPRIDPLTNKIIDNQTGRLTE
jgi:hypothetical protein